MQKVLIRRVKNTGRKIKRFGGFMEEVKENEKKEDKGFNFSFLESIKIEDEEKIIELERQEEERLQEEKKRKLEENYKKVAPPRYINESLATYKVSAENQNSYKWIVGFCEAVENHKNKKNLIYINGKSGTGKEEWVEQIIPTPQGYRRFGDLNIGDYVFDSDGKPTKVLGIYPQGVKDSYKVTLSDGRTDECGLEHLWGVYTRSQGKWKYQTLTVNESGAGRFYIPASPVVEYEEKKLACNPYILGSFIGNGCNTQSRLCLSSNDEWQVKKCASILNCRAVKYSSCNYNWFFKKEHFLKVKDILPKEICCYSQEKRIPAEYLFSSVAQRYDLIQGLFDTDGGVSVSSNRLHITYSTTSKGLSEDVRNLLLSVGVVSTIVKDTRKEHICYCLNINYSKLQGELLFSLPRKKMKVKSFGREKRRDYSKVLVKNIEKLTEKKEMMCIYVENENHLYLTKDYIVTHNTHLALGMIRKLGGQLITSLELCITYDSCRDFNSSKTRIQLLKDLCRQKVLVIDEIGKGIERIEKEIVPYIINEFYNESSKILIFTGNEKNEDFEKLIGESSTDRFNGNGIYISLVGESQRK